MLRIESARDVDQDLSALEHMSDGFLDFRHRINRSDRDTQRTGGDERSGFDLRWQNLRHMIEIAQEEAFDRQVLAYDKKGVDRHRPSGRRCVGDEYATVRQQLNKRCCRITAH
jgi:hypothetical protein